MLQLRDYQEAAIESAREKLRDGARRIIIGMPTGGGKTEVAMSMIRAAVDKGSSASFIADRRSLIQQTSRRFSDAGIAHGVLMGKDTYGTSMNVRVESAQTIQSRGLRKSDFFVMDEVHEVRPDIVRMIAESGAILIGLTATPFPALLSEPIDSHLKKEEQKKGAPPRYEGLVSTITTDKLIADGYLCPFDVIAPEASIDTEGVKTQGGEFHRPSLAKRVMRIVGDIVPTWRGVLDDRYGGEIQPTIAFCVSVDEAEILQNEFRKGGLSARIVSSRETDEHNQKTIEAFRTGEFDVLVNCAMLSRGNDFPRAVIGIDAYPMKKILTPIQRIGRFLRTFDGKEKATIIDHAENWLHMRDKILSFYNFGPEWPPPESANKNARKKKPERDAICKHCRTVIPPGDKTCPGCGKEKPAIRYGGEGRKLERVDGKLKLIDSITGEVSAYGGDLWPEICTQAVKIARGDSNRARRRAIASFKAITGKWPPREMKYVKGEPDPAVVDLMHRKFQAWIIAKNAGNKKRSSLSDRYRAASGMDK